MKFFFFFIALLGFPYVSFGNETNFDRYLIEKDIDRVEALIEEAEMQSMVITFFIPKVERLLLYFEQAPDPDFIKISSMLREIKESLERVEEGNENSELLRKLNRLYKSFRQHNGIVSFASYIHQSWDKEVQSDSEYQKIFNRRDEYIQRLRVQVQLSITNTISNSDIYKNSDFRKISFGLADAIDFLTKGVREDPEDNYIPEAIVSINNVLEGFEVKYKGSKVALINSLKERINDLKEQKNNIDSKLQELLYSHNENRVKLQNSIERKALDQSLSIAIYLMIGTLLLMFVLLRFFKSEEIKGLIEHRTLVEIVSIAFILLTIIILGTGEKIGTETLGTLLGTIAGYIFARRPNSNDKE